jgi:Protein of unknown function (DUF2800)
MMNLHSRIGPSSAALVMACVGSVQAQDAVGRPPAGEAAIRGTALHAEAERLLRGGAPRGGQMFSLRYEPPEVALYVTEVRRIAARAGVELQVEMRLNLSRFHPELFGTADALVVDLAWGVLTIFDFKSGLIQIDASALQLRLYAGMVYLSLPPADQAKIKTVITCIVQPNGGGDPVRRARHRVADILRTLSDYVDIAHVATDDPDPPRTAGSHCRAHFCAARTTCPAFRELTVLEAAAEFSPVDIGGDSSASA